MRYFDVDYLTIKRMSLMEYRLRMAACELRHMDHTETAARDALFHRHANAYKKSGEYIAKNIKDIYDKEEQERHVWRHLYPEKQGAVFERLKKVAARVKEYEQKKGEAHGG